MRGSILPGGESTGEISVNLGLDVLTPLIDHKVETALQHPEFPAGRKRLNVSKETGKGILIGVIYSKTFPRPALPKRN